PPVTVGFLSARAPGASTGRIPQHARWWPGRRVTDSNPGDPIGVRWTVRRPGVASPIQQVHRRAAPTARGVAISGSEPFVSATIRALDALHASGSFQKVNRNICGIHQESPSGVFGWLGRPIMGVGEPTWRAETVWYASSIAHDAYHVQLFREEREARGGREP